MHFGPRDDGPPGFDLRTDIPRDRIIRSLRRLTQSVEALPDRVLQAAARLRDTAMSGVSARVDEDIALDPTVQ
ncbi:MAG: hypothetical protein AAGI50_07245 [Pseudomonadota bacterium]